MSWKKGMVVLFVDVDVIEEGTLEEFRLNPASHEIAISQCLHEDLKTETVILMPDQIRRLVNELKSRGVSL